MKMIRMLFYVFFTLVAVLLGGCGGQSGVSADKDSSDVAQGQDSVIMVGDSVVAVDTVVKPATPPERKFASAEEAVAFMENSGHWAEYQAGILPRMADEVLEYAGKLLNNTHKYFIIVDKAAMKVILYDKYGRMVKDYGCAAAKNYGDKHRKGDSRTAEGYFTAEGIYDSTDWLFTNDDGYTSPARGQFGPRFIRLKGAPMIGIHGTAAPRSIGRRVSHGCIRVTNENILDLVKYAEAGMPIIVSPGPRDRSINEKEGHRVPVVTTGVAPLEVPETATRKKEKTTPTKSVDSVKVEHDGSTETKESPVEVKKETPAEEPKETPAKKETESPE